MLRAGLRATENWSKFRLSEGVGKVELNQATMEELIVILLQ